MTEQTTTYSAQRGALGAASTATAQAGLDAKAQRANGATFVLVHGAWHGGWCWKKVRPLLQAAGHTVYTPTLTGLGERAHLSRPDIDLDTHIQDVVKTIECEDLNQVILVGHSYAGMVITGVAARVPSRLAQVVYLDAFLPEEGKSLNDYSIGAGAYDQNVREHGDGWRLPLAGTLTLQMLGITDPADVAWMAPRMVDQPYKTFTQASGTAAGSAKDVRHVYLLSSERKHYLEAAQRARAKGFRVLNVPGAGHDVMVTQPREMVDALLTLV